VRRAAVIALLVVTVAGLLAFGLGTNTGITGGYTVRAIFDNASFVTPGEDVKVAGVKVGKVKSLDVTDDKKAAIGLEISDAGFAPFHADAHCSIRPQSLIGERYLDCTPGTHNQPELGAIPNGQKGAGQHLLAVTHTSSPVDIDLVGNIMRLPYRERLALIINEFGAGLAGNGAALNQVIHRADPALNQTDQVLAILAKQNRTLANLATDSDAVIAPLAAKRTRVSHFVVAANQTAQATAERSADIVRTFQRLPTFLNQLKPTLVDLGSVSRQSTPVLADLNTAAPDLNRFTRELGPFSQAGIPALTSLGHAAVVGRPALVNSLGLTRDLATFAKNAGPVGKNLVALANSLDKTGGIERVMDYLFFQMTAVNGFDGVSHYLRAGLLTNLCSSYATDPISGCNANYTTQKSIRGAGVTATNKNDEVLKRTEQALAADQAPAPKPGATRTNATDPFSALHELTDPRIARQRNQSLNASRGGGRTTSPAYGQQSAQDQALDYLLGNDR
jgi:phospholipid/cholesterol/gamma-HCH transport system substrate-binding protein